MWVDVGRAGVRRLAEIPEPVVIGVGAGVAGIPEAVRVEVPPTDIGHGGTVVQGAGVHRKSGIAAPIRVAISTEIAGVAETVPVSVALIRIAVRGAVDRTGTARTQSTPPSD
jgi:hypothetical protein